MELTIGCCGWGYFNAKSRFGNDWKSKFKSKLQAYAHVFNAVEVNSTFYKLPQFKTAQKWYEEAKEVNENFIFTVKVHQEITHKLRFGKENIPMFEKVKQICEALNSRILLFQTPASFKPIQENIEKLEEFFRNIERDHMVFVWEPRGAWHDNAEIIKSLCKKLNLVLCVDPLRNELVCKKPVAYFRLHGFGKPSMYNYKFSDEELKRLKTIVEETKATHTYVFFNNIYMYEDAIRFSKLFKEK